MSSIYLPLSEGSVYLNFLSNNDDSLWMNRDIGILIRESESESERDWEGLD